jgi:hypothetical protein
MFPIRAIVALRACATFDANRVRSPATCSPLPWRAPPAPSISIIRSATDTAGFVALVAAHGRQVGLQALLVDQCIDDVRVE